ncbi:hypothetical protein RHGRI_017319 [Rhododendron griersonianum]|uniref:Uncharacterized protein n=1 Tax=Rhododendron griersonianum TaxID=479676 RepID=A0AAV6JXC7_9ERIC|nr:hypothetical protein RHGRI_017319 [Rhododendron griersonianum]
MCRLEPQCLTPPRPPLHYIITSGTPPLLAGTAPHHHRCKPSASSPLQLTPLHAVAAAPLDQNPTAAPLL